MNARLNLPFALAAGMTIAALGIAWQQWHARQELESSLAALQEKRSEEAVARQDLAARLQAAENHRAQRHAALEKAQKPKVAVSSPSATQPLDIVHRDPGVQVLWLASRRAHIAASYGPLFQSLSLTPAQIETFQAITLRREELAMDLAAIMRAQRLVAHDPALNRLRQKADDEERTARLDLLGAEGYRQLQEYLRTLPAREMVQALAGAAAISRVPFRAEQTAQLTQLLAGASEHYRSGGAVNLQSIDWNIADRQARTVLSAEQFALYQTIEPEGRGGRFSSRVTQAITLARKAEAAAANGK